MIRNRVETRIRPLVAERGVVAGGNLVAQTGVEIMQKGGNAVDAGVAAAFVAQLTEPGMCGVGGNGTILVHHAESNETTIFNDGPFAPAAAKPDMFEVLPGSGSFYGWANVRDDANIMGHKSVAVPGTVAGLSAALERYGTLSLREALAPAIELAVYGVDVDQRMATIIAREMKHFRQFPLLGALLLVDGLPPTPGTFWEPGDKLVNLDLAETYRAIAEGGADAFYKGPIAHAIASEMSKHGGILTYEDLATYSSEVKVLEEKDFLTYRGLRYTPGSSRVVVQFLNVLENFDLAGLEPHSPTFCHLMLEAMRWTWVNHFAFALEPGLLTKAHADEVADRIRLDQASHDVRPLDPQPYQRPTRPSDRLASGAAQAGSDPWLFGETNTTTLAAADCQGNVINILTSLGNAFGSKVVVPGTGIVLNDHMCSFDPIPGRALSLGPTRRPARGTHLPLFFRDGKPWLALSASGARRSMSSVFHVLAHSIDFDMGLQEAIETPRVWAEALYPEAFLDSRIPKSTQQALAELGHRTVSLDPFTSGGFGRPTAVSIAASGRLHGGADPMYSTEVAGF